MNTTHTLRLLALAGLSPLLALPALALDCSYYYLGAGAGQSRTSIDEQRIADVLAAPGSATITKDGHDTAYKIFGGYQINRSVGIEAGYFNLGKFGFRGSSPAGTLAGQIRSEGVNLDLVGTLPLSDRWSVLGRVGAQYARTRDEFSGTGVAAGVKTNPSERGAGYKAGFGLQYAFSDSIVLRGEAERYRVADGVGGHGNVDVVGLSLVFPFGRSAAPAPRAAAAPAYVAPPVVVAPPPPVVVAAAPIAAPPAPRRVSFSAESLFGFDKSVVSPQGKTALDQFAAELSGTRFDTVNVEGHTDRLGSEAYNQKLSSERAEAVKTYLVGNGHIDAAKVSAVGKGETMPVTKAADCKGNSASPALITCLQPDRRVEIEVVGTR